MGHSAEAEFWDYSKIDINNWDNNWDYNIIKLLSEAELSFNNWDNNPGMMRMSPHNS